MDKTYSKKNNEQIATHIEKYKTKTLTKNIEDNNEFLEKQKEEQIEHNSKYKETTKSKWCFRILALVIIIMFICGTIFIEMERLKKNPESRETAIAIANNFSNSMVSLQDSWNTIYYFYQSGDLFNILNCRQNINKNHSRNNDKDNLIVLYRDRIDKNTNINLLKDVSCGQKIYVYLEKKQDIEQSSSNNKELYSFVVGEEPVELLTKFPLLQYAIYKLKIGEKATFVARQQLSQRTKLKNQTIYNMEIISQDNHNLSNRLPPYIIYNENIGKIDIKGQTICNSNLNIKYTITDIDENPLYVSDIVKINIGSGLFNPAIEHLLLKTHSHEEIKIFLSKKFYQPSKYLPENLFNNREVVIINIKIY